LAPASAARAERRAHGDGWLTVEQEGLSSIEPAPITCVDAIPCPQQRYAWRHPPTIVTQSGHGEPIHRRTWSGSDPAFASSQLWCPFSIIFRDW